MVYGFDFDFGVDLIVVFIGVYVVRDVGFFFSTVFHLYTTDLVIN